MQAKGPLVTRIFKEWQFLLFLGLCCELVDLNTLIWRSERTNLNNFKVLSNSQFKTDFRNQYNIPHDYQQNSRAVN